MLTFTHQRLSNFSSIVFFCVFLISIRILTVNDWKWPVHLWRDACLAEAHTWTAKKKRISKINRTSDQARWGQEPHSFSHTRFVVSKYARFQCFDESWRVSLMVLWRREKKWTRLLYLSKISHTWFIKNQREYHLIQFLILAFFGKPKQRDERCCCCWSLSEEAALMCKCETSSSSWMFTWWAQKFKFFCRFWEVWGGKVTQKWS